MQIEYYKDHNKQQLVDFSEINDGECFIAQIIHTYDGLSTTKLYMKLKTTQLSPFVKNAVDLETGSLCYFERDVEVIPLFYPDVKIVVKEKYENCDMR